MTDTESTTHEWDSRTVWNCILVALLLVSINQGCVASERAERAERRVQELTIKIETIEVRVMGSNDPEEHHGSAARSETDQGD